MLNVYIQFYIWITIIELQIRKSHLLFDITACPHNQILKISDIHNFIESSDNQIGLAGSIVCKYYRVVLDHKTRTLLHARNQNAIRKKLLD